MRSRRIRSPAALTTRAAVADMKGIRRRRATRQPGDPRRSARSWPHDNKGMALAELGETDGALAALFAAEQHFTPPDSWGRSVAIYGRAHTLRRRGAAPRPVRPTKNTLAFVGKDDPQAAEIARRYAADCRAPAPAGCTAPTPAAGARPATAQGLTARLSRRQRRRRRRRRRRGTAADPREPRYRPAGEPCGRAAVARHVPLHRVGGDDRAPASPTPRRSSRCGWRRRARR